MKAILSASVRLEVYEPWEQTEIMLGKVLRVVELSGRTYIQILPYGKSGVFMVSARYVGEGFEELKNGKKVHVAIYYSDTDLDIDAEVDPVNPLHPYLPYGRGGLILNDKT